MTHNDKAPRRGRMSDTLKKRIEGDLMPLVEYVSRNQELDIQLRDNYFNVYFNGGNILKVKPKSLFFNPWYFYYNEYKGVEIHKTYIEEQLKDKPRDKRPKNYPSSKLAKEIYESIEKEAKELLEMAEKGDYESYFREAEKIVKKWVKDHNRLERKKQHIIACSNRRFTQNNNLVVIDLEYAVSTLKPYNNAHTAQGKKKAPKMDIIAVDEDGQIYAIELKDNLRADKYGSPQDVNHHLADFKNSIGSDDVSNDFPQEMKEVVEIKSRMGLLDGISDVPLKRPIFAIAYSGEAQKDLDEFKKKHSDLQLVEIVRRENGKKLYLNIHP